MTDITKDQFWNMLNEPEPVIKSNSDGSKIYMWYNEQGKRHRENDLPAEIWYDGNNLLISESWYQNGKRHRINGPTEIWYYDNGIISIVHWHCYGKLHRDNGPATIMYNRDGSIGSLDDWKNGEFIKRTSL